MLIRNSVVILLTLIVGLSFSSCNRHIAQQKTITHSYYFTCPMHEDYVAFRPGKCPQCGMSLEQRDMKDIPRRTPSNSYGNSMGSSSHGGGCH